jgi:hypothetical protein
MNVDLLTRLSATPAIVLRTVDRMGWHERGRRWSNADAIVMTPIAPGIEYRHDGPDALEFAWVQFDLWSNDAAALPVLVKLLRDEMERAPSVTVGSTKFYPAFVEGDRTAVPEDLDGGTRMYRRIVDFRFYHEPA